MCDEGSHIQTYIFELGNQCRTSGGEAGTCEMGVRKHYRLGVLDCHLVAKYKNYLLLSARTICKYHKILWISFRSGYLLGLTIFSFFSPICWYRFFKRITSQLQHWAFLTYLHGKPRNFHIFRWKNVRMLVTLLHTRR